MRRRRIPPHKAELSTKENWDFLRDLKLHSPEVWKKDGGFWTADAMKDTRHRIGKYALDKDGMVSIATPEQVKTLVDIPNVPDYMSVIGLHNGPIGQYDASDDSIAIATKYPSLYRMVLALRHELQHRQQHYNAHEQAQQDIDDGFGSLDSDSDYINNDLDIKFSKSGIVGPLPGTGQGYSVLPWERDPAEWDATAAELGYLLHLAGVKEPTDADLDAFFNYEYSALGLPYARLNDAYSTIGNSRRQLQAIKRNNSSDKDMRLYTPAEQKELIKAYYDLIRESQETGHVKISDERLKQLDTHLSNIDRKKAMAKQIHSMSRFN